MFDHVTLRTADFAATSRAYRPPLAVLGAEPSAAEDWLIEWDDFGFSPADADHPATAGVHIGLVAASHDVVDAFWDAGLAAGLSDDGEPGMRTIYGSDYYGGFLLDGDGNSIEACVHDGAGPPGYVDHVWLRVADVAASRDFYAALAPYTGFDLVVEEPDLARFRGSSASFTVLAGTPVSRHLHLAFGAAEDATVEAFHAAALDAGHRDNGAPGERPEYHPGYYGAFVLDPDGHNVEVVNHHR
jgi:catechol 2,3-dioxygenase-like lactoylglutathione lyase family enzyme